MAIVDSAPEGGKFRAFAASGLDGTSGAWGNGDLLCVNFDASGDLVAASAVTDAIGVILTSEGKRDSTHADFKKVEGGRPYTVMRRAIFVEVDDWTSPTASAGDEIWASTSGDVVEEASAATGAIYLGQVVGGDGTGGAKFVLDVALKAAHA